VFGFYADFRHVFITITQGPAFLENLPEITDFFKTDELLIPKDF
jgi:hypothetical protein